MALIKTETYTDENNILHEVKYFGRDADHISGIVDAPIIEYEEPEVPLSDSDILAQVQLNTEYLACMAEINN
ncbi:hypothetical protein [Anaerolentibacter hominis]|uniref:hypothetical protein n=1 Tax=Anaerolentibacter hominis TaxID=3079009 RepID=UPI0031B81F42